VLKSLQIVQKAGFVHYLRGIQDGTLSEEATGPWIGQNPQDLVLSLDGSLIALPSGGGNHRPDDSHPSQNYGTYLYNPADLSSLSRSSSRARTRRPWDSTSRMTSSTPRTMITT
jgi:hypothetical protein